jgi:SAM-dependent methyltransferase
VPRYYFSVYHWRRRLRRLFLGLAAIAAGVAGREQRRPVGRLFAAAALVWGCLAVGGTLRRLSTPPPWRVDTEKYEALAEMLPLASADRVVDVGCGTGRSLVGLAPAVDDAATVVALDVFDDRVILGNGPELARRNATAAGHSVRPVRGDASALPLAGGSADVVTACRVLHDLPKADARAALAEARRALAPDGTLGVLELPIPHDEGADPAAYWCDLLAEAGFTVTDRRTLDGDYFLLAAAP